MSEWWEISISLASAIVAACALGVTVWQGRQNYMHNKLSVRPLLKTSKISKFQGGENVITIKMTNSGLGPAIIKDFILIFNDNEVSKNNFDSYQDFIKLLTKNVVLLKLYSYRTNASILAGETQELISFRYKNGQDATFIDKLDWRITYWSMYKDEIFVYETEEDLLFHGREVRNA